MAPKHTPAAQTPLMLALAPCHAAIHSQPVADTSCRCQSDSSIKQNSSHAPLKAVCVGEPVRADTPAIMEPRSMAELRLVIVTSQPHP